MSSLVRPHEPRNEHANDASSAAPPTYRSASSAWAVPSAGRAPAFESPVEGQAPSLAASHSGPSPAREAAALAVNDDAARTGLVKLANGVALPLGAVQSIRAGSHSASAYGLATAPPPESVANLEDLDRQCALKQLHSGHGLAGSSGPAAAPVLCSFPTAGEPRDGCMAREGVVHNTTVALFDGRMPGHKHEWGGLLEGGSSPGRSLGFRQQKGIGEDSPPSLTSVVSPILQTLTMTRAEWQRQPTWRPSMAACGCGER